MSFLPHYCHSFHITVIPSELLSFLPDYCHSFQIIVIPSGLVSFLPNIVIPSKLLPFQIFVILNSSSTLPYPEGEENGHQRWPLVKTTNSILLGLKLLEIPKTFRVQTRKYLNKQYLVRTRPKLELRVQVKTSLLEKTRKWIN